MRAHAESAVTKRPPTTAGRRTAHPALIALQRSAGNRAVAAVLQRDGAGTPAGDRVRSVLRSGGANLDAAFRVRAEAFLGSDLSHVRVHTGHEAAASAAAVQAHAYTSGSDIVFGGGMYDTTSTAGQSRLVHELAHVVQQQRGPVAGTVGTDGLAISDPSDRFEREAERTGAAFVAGGAATGVLQRESGTREPAGAGPAPVGTSSPSAPLALQRHSSWEHMLIGDLTPEELGTLGTAYDAAQGQPGETFDIAPGKKVNAADVAHVIEQEIRRLGYFQTNPPRGSATDIEREQKKLVDKDVGDRMDAATSLGDKAAAFHEATVDKKWDVKLVSIPSQNTSFMVTYGELNTMADFFGSVTEMSAMKSAYLDRIIRGVRQSTMLKLIKLYKTVTGTKDKEAKKRLGVGSTDFKPAGGAHFWERGKNALPMGGVVNELKTMGSLPSLSGRQKPKVGGTKATTYSSTLARNACHFAPESWHAWADHHEKALALADQAFLAGQAGNDVLAADLQNKALLNNGFGDHYLQDSYAAGHLINKTLIMKWYTQYLDKHAKDIDFHRNKNWRKAQDMAYGQGGLATRKQFKKSGAGQARTVRGQQVGSGRDPQAVYNIAGGDWRVKAEAMGLKVPSSVRAGSDSHTVLTAWQSATLTTRFAHHHRTVRELHALVAGQNVDVASCKRALAELIRDGVVRWSSYSVTDRAADVNAIEASLKNSSKLILREAWIPKKANAAAFAGALADPTGAQYDDMALGVRYNEYLEFMNSAFLQKAANTLHNRFCKDGLAVAANQGDTLFKVYGDDNMFQREAGKGLVESGRTAQYSRDAVFTAAESGSAAVAGNLTTAAILDRLPAWVQDPATGAQMSLRHWHTRGALKAYCETTVFPGMGWKLTEKFAPGALGRDLGKVDDRPDKSDVF